MAYTDPRSRWVDLGIPVRYLDFGGPPGAPVIVAVHGLGGAAINWLAIAPALTAKYRVLAPDLAGHGLTQGHGHSTSVAANRRLLDRFLASVTGGPVMLMGNSMGGMIALLQAGTEPSTVAGLILLDPALPFLPAVPDPVVAAVFAFYTAPLLGPALVAQRHRLGPDRLVSAVLRFCCVDPSRVPADVVAEHVILTRERAAFLGADRDLIHSARSVVATARGGGRHSAGYRAAIRAVGVPVLVIHGEQDRLVPVSASRAIVRRHSNWQLVVLPMVGHVPQLEAPAQTAEIVERWLTGPGRAAAESAAHPLIDEGSSAS